jgi:hypothetical protein
VSSRTCIHSAVRSLSSSFCCASSMNSAIRLIWSRCCSRCDSVTLSVGRGGALPTTLRTKRCCCSSLLCLCFFDGTKPSASLSCWLFLLGPGACMSDMEAPGLVAVGAGRAGAAGGAWGWGSAGDEPGNGRCGCCASHRMYASVSLSFAVSAAGTVSVRSLFAASSKASSSTCMPGGLRTGAGRGTSGTAGSWGAVPSPDFPVVAFIASSLPVSWVAGRGTVGTAGSWGAVPSPDFPLVAFTAPTLDLDWVTCRGSPGTAGSRGALPSPDFPVACMVPVVACRGTAGTAGS